MKADSIRAWGSGLASALVAACLVLLAPSAARAATGDSPQVVPVFGQAASDPRMEPLDTEYATYILKSLGPFAGIEQGDYVPSPVSAVPDSPQQGYGLASGPPPSSYDLRATGRLTPIRNQGSYGTCWAFAANGSMESGLMPSDPADFSEDHMALASGFFSAGTSATDLYNTGGNFEMSMAYLARWSGPVYESDQPYNTGHVVPGLAARRHVQNIDVLPSRTGPLDNGVIKAAIMEHGAVETSMLWTSSAYNTATRAYYYTGTSSNHAVDLVGWDDAYSADNFRLRPPGNGAWIVRNSWGSSFGSGGYFYISYHDGALGKRGSIVVNTAETANNYGTILQYDTLGRTASYGFGSATAWFMNRFAVGGASTLRAVAFYARTAGSAFEVYAGTGALALVASGTIETAGYHSVTLPSPAFVPSGSTLSVAVKLTTPGSSYPIPIEAMFTGYSDQATSSAGQGFVSSNGVNWSDVGGIGSVCLKAFIDPAIDDGAAPVTTHSATPASDTAGWNRTAVSVSLVASDAGSGVRVTRYRLNSGATVTYAGPVSISAQGTTTLTYWSEDWAGNAEASKTASFRLDTIAPTTTVHRDPPANDAGWNQGSVVVTLSASDAGSGIEDGAIHYRLGSGEESTYSAPISIADSGTTTLAYWTRDKAGNVEATKTADIRIDSAVPTVSINTASQYVNVAPVQASAADTISGIGRTEMSLDTTSAWSSTRQLTTSVPGTHTVFARVWDRAGNSAETSATFNVLRVVSATRLTRPVSSPWTPKRGKSVRFSAQLSPGGAALTASSKLYLYHRETKTVSRQVAGTKKRVRVAYWRLRGTHPMAADSLGRLAWSGRLAYRGSWKIHVRYTGCAFYTGATSATRYFWVK